MEILSKKQQQQLFLGSSAVECGAALICHFNVGVSSFYYHRLRIARSIYKESEKAKNLGKLCQKQ